MPTYREVIEDLFRPLTPEDGATEEQIRAAEERLGVRLPAVLREFYRTAGRMEPFTEAFDRVLPCRDLDYQGGALVFCEENQVVVMWGILREDLDLNDPPVYQGAPDEEPEWHLDHEHLSDFLLSMACWQAVCSEKEKEGVSGSAMIDAATVECIALAWPEIPLATDDFRAFHRPGRLVVTFEGEEGHQLLATATTREGFRALTDELEITWDYSGLEDDEEEEA